jgi:DNA-binding winged helix-turn-helix (wHTH) protein
MSTIEFASNGYKFRLDCEAELLFRLPDEHIKIERKPLELLKYFLENPEKLHTQDKLLDKLWDDPDVTYIALTSAIGKLRQAIAPTKCVTTKQTVGYYFNAESIVHSTDDEDETKDTPPWPNGARVEIDCGGFAPRSSFTVDFLVGRTKDSDLFVNNDAISRPHAWITMENGKFYFRPLKPSRNFLKTDHGFDVVSDKVQIFNGTEMIVGSSPDAEITCAIQFRIWSTENEFCEAPTI